MTLVLDATLLLDITLLSFLVVTALAMVRMHSLFGVVMTSGIYSLLSAALFMVMDAVDVAFTEAAVGAGISTVIMLATLALVGQVQKPAKRRHHYAALGIVVLTGGALIYGHLRPAGLRCSGQPGTGQRRDRTVRHRLRSGSGRAKHRDLRTRQLSRL